MSGYSFGLLIILYSNCVVWKIIRILAMERLNLGMIVAVYKDYGESEVSQKVFIVLSEMILEKHVEMLKQII